jgi:hypothetical protein
VLPPSGGDSGTEDTVAAGAKSATDFAASGCSCGSFGSKDVGSGAIVAAVVWQCDQFNE